MVVTYNQKNFIGECLDSILAQDYENFEIVVADDFSTDGTREILQEYKNKYTNKFVLKFADKNQGITKNSNLALFACSANIFVHSQEMMYFCQAKFPNKLNIWKKIHNAQYLIIM